jgi:hypothetical protein
VEDAEVWGGSKKLMNAWRAGEKGTDWHFTGGTTVHVIRQDEYTGVHVVEMYG